MDQSVYLALISGIALHSLLVVHRFYDSLLSTHVQRDGPNSPTSPPYARSVQQILHVLGHCDQPSDGYMTHVRTEVFSEVGMGTR